MIHEILLCVFVGVYLFAGDIFGAPYLVGSYYTEHLEYHSANIEANKPKSSLFRAVISILRK